LADLHVSIEEIDCVILPRWFDPHVDRASVGIDGSRLVAFGRIEASVLNVVRVKRRRADSQSVVHGNPELRLASQVALRRLDRPVTEQELNLIQFAACEVTETRARAPQIVRGQLVDAGAGTLVAYHASLVSGHPSAPHDQKRYANPAENVGII
jgi:hypothetical protein